MNKNHLVPDVWYSIKIRLCQTICLHLVDIFRRAWDASTFEAAAATAGRVNEKQLQLMGSITESLGSRVQINLLQFTPHMKLLLALRKLTDLYDYLQLTSPCWDP